MKSYQVESIGTGALWGADGCSHPGASEKLTASEQMFFRGSPLAHIVRYEEELHCNRQRRFLASLGRDTSKVEGGCRRREHGADSQRRQPRHHCLDQY